MDMAIDALIVQLHHKRAAVRWKAALALGMTGDPQGIPPLLQALRDRNVHVRQNASHALALLGAPALPYLIESLTAKDPHVRRLIPYALAEIRHEQSLAPLLAALEDPDHIVRAQVVMALKFFPGELSYHGLLRALTDPDDNVRYFALQSLRYRGVRQEDRSLLAAAEATLNPRGSPL